MLGNCRSECICAIGLTMVGLAIGGRPAVAADPPAGVSVCASDPATGQGPTDATRLMPSDTVPGSPGVDRSAPVPDDATLEANGAAIGEVVITAGDIFDPEKPGEHYAIFRLANRLHPTTRDRVIRRQLLFKSGDRYSRRVLDESERILRDTGYFYDAEIDAVRYDGERVDVEVKTRDVWTLQGGVGFHRSGGENSTRFGIQDQNFLGTGKDLTLRHSSSVDRTETLYRYKDPSLFGTRGQLQLWYSDNSDGSRKLVVAERPFYSLSTLWTAGTSAANDDRVDSLYNLGNITAQFRHEITRAEVYGGISRGLVNGKVRRLRFGFTYQEDRFRSEAGLSAIPALPPDRTLAYPWIGFDRVEDGFITVRDLDRIQKTEDHNLGREIHARLGWSAPAFGGDRSRAIYEGSLTQGVSPGDGQLLFVTASLTGRFAGGQAEDLRVGGGMRYYVRDLGEHIFYASLRGDVAENLDPEDQLLLGGDSGLRGYPLRYVSGDRRILLTLEQRIYTRWHVMKLLHVGGAVFFDAGRAWFTNDQSNTNVTYLKDIGFGLRLSSSRSSEGGMVHVDVAFPLNRMPGMPRSQFLITSAQTF